MCLISMPPIRGQRRSGDGSEPEDPGYYACGISVTDGIRGQEEWIRMHSEIEGQYSSIDMLRYSDIVSVLSHTGTSVHYGRIGHLHVGRAAPGRHHHSYPGSDAQGALPFDPARYPAPDGDVPAIF